MKIDREIELLKEKLNGIEEKSFDYLPSGLKELQNHVLTAHARFEGSLGARIWMKIKREIDEKKEIKNPFFLLKSLTLQKILDRLSFIEKLNFVINFNDGIPSEKLKVINKYRIEFAHPNAFSIRDKYNYQDPKGKINIRNLFRAIIECDEEMDSYYLKFLKVKSNKDIK